jgi:hypothetical protein
MRVTVHLALAFKNDLQNQLLRSSVIAGIRPVSIEFDILIEDEQLPSSN